MMRPAILARLRGVQRAGDGWSAFRPAHRDEAKRSLSVALGDDGRTLVHGFVGCTPEAVCAAVNMSLSDLAAPGSNGTQENGGPTARRGITLADFAEAKRLPVDFLVAHGVIQDGDALRITYYLRDGQLAPRQRRRSALVAKDGSSWLGSKADGAVVPYGRDRLDAAV